MYNWVMFIMNIGTNPEVFNQNLSAHVIEYAGHPGMTISEIAELNLQGGEGLCLSINGGVPEITRIQMGMSGATLEPAPNLPSEEVLLAQYGNRRVTVCRVPYKSSSMSSAYGTANATWVVERSKRLSYERSAGRPGSKRFR